MTALVRYDAACRALAEAVAVDEVKDILDKATAMKVYARQAKNPQLEADAWEIRKRAEDRLGELSAALDKAPGAREPLPSGGKRLKAEVLKDAGLSTSTAQRYEQFHKLPAAEKERRIAKGREAIENGRTVADKIVHGTQGTGDNEWYTPAEYIDAARAVLGAIDLDPASNESAQQRVKAAKYFTQETDGLTQDWHGRVWLNPPYAQPLIERFADKMLAQLACGNVTAAVVLTNNSTDTAWFQKLAPVAGAICFTAGRISFVSLYGKSGSPTQGQTFFYFGANRETFFNVFAPFGFVSWGAAHE
jgi:phage N-6-adenine-methyltransferase